MKKIWERYFLKETLKILFLIIFSFYGLYILIDYTNHSKNFQPSPTSPLWKELSLNYGCEFIELLDTLLPFALMVAVIRTVMHLNTSHEMTALLTTGTKLKRLLRPFVLIALSGTALIYINTQFLYPKALQAIRHLDDAKNTAKMKKRRPLAAQYLALKDQSTLIFQDYQTHNKEFFDTYWVKSYDEIYRIKYLNPHGQYPIGRYVDQLVRDENHRLVKVASFEEKSFDDMHFNKKALLDSLTPSEELSLTSLWQKLSYGNEVISEKQSQISAQFYKKLLMPWLCLLAVLAPLPFCIQFSRTPPTLLIYAVSLFALVAFIIGINASVVLASRQVLSPIVAILGPFLLFSIPVTWRYARL